MEGLDGLHTPGLPFLSLFLRPDDRLPVRCQDEARAGVTDFDPIAAAEKLGATMKAVSGKKKS